MAAETLATLGSPPAQSPQPQGAPRAASLREGWPSWAAFAPAFSGVCSQAAEAAEEIIADGGMDPVLVSLRRQEDVQARILNDPADLAQRVDGVLMIDVDLTAGQTAALSASGLAIASVGMNNVPWDNVGIDNVSAATEATNRLLALGHWDIAFLSGTKTGNGTTQATEERRRGFEAALAAHDATVHPDWVVEAGYTIEGGRRAMSELVRHRGELPSAAFAVCDEVAFGALMALKEHGLSCPEDVSIIGIDDHPMSWVLGLTTIAQPFADEAAFAASLLLDRLQKPDDAGAAGSHLLSTALVDRTTTRRNRT